MTTCCSCRPSGSTPQPSTGRGTWAQPTTGRTSWRPPRLVVEPRLASWRDALGELAGAEPVLAGSGSTWFVEGGPAEAGTASGAELRLGDEAGRLVRARTVPGDWSGSNWSGRNGE